MKYLDELKNLNLPTDKFAVFGSGPLGIRNLREINDLDIIVKISLWEELKENHPVQKNIEKGYEYIQIGNIEIYKVWGGGINNIDELIDEADIINGIRFVKMERVLEWKKKVNREKDQEDIKIIINYLKDNKQ